MIFYKSFCYSFDIVFEGRNKSYGAYLLRKMHNKHLAVAVFLGTFCIAMTIAAPVLYKNFYLTEIIEKEKIMARKCCLCMFPVPNYTDTIPKIPCKKRVSSIRFPPPEPSHDDVICEFYEEANTNIDSTVPKKEDSLPIKPTPIDTSNTGKKDLLPQIKTDSTNKKVKEEAVFIFLAGKQVFNKSESLNKVFSVKIQKYVFFRQKLGIYNK